MNRTRFLLYVFAGTLVFAGVVWAFHRWRETGQKRAVWAAAKPVRPDLAKWPAVFSARLAAAEARLTAPKVDVAALGELSRLYHANGFVTEAEQGYRALLVFDSREPRWPHLLAALLSEYGRLDEALPLLRQTVALAPDYAPARLHLADALVKLNRSDEAAAAYRDLLLVAPKNPYALLGLARLDLGAGRLADARTKLQKAIAIHPKFSGAQSLLATVSDLLGDESVASAARDQAAEAGRFRDAADAWTEELVDYCYDVYRLHVVAAGRTAGRAWREALPPLERALTLAPGNPGTHRQLGKVFLALNELPRAREQLEKAVALDPGNPAAYIDLVGVYRATSDVPAALRSLESGLTLCPEDAGLHYEYALALLARRQLADAVPHLETARRLSPEKPFAARDLISTYFRLNREPDAARVLDEELVKHPEFSAFLVMAARYRIMKHQPDEAAALLVKARAAGSFPGDIAGLTEDFRRTFGYPPR